MSNNQVISIIGAGVMGEAMIGGLLRSRIAAAENILVSDPRLERGDELLERYGVHLVADNLSIAQKATGAVVLAVKPQQLRKVMAGLKGKIPENVPVLSIVAGASTDLICRGLEHTSVVRAMPNTPARIGEGVTVWYASPDVSSEQVGLVTQILRALGSEVQVDEERYLDMATALSGTGPAYVFLFMEAMIDAGVHLGFPRHIAKKLVLETLRGSVNFYDFRKEHPAELRNEVTSPGGTSAEALYYLEKAGFRTAISRAIWAAFERSQELGQGLNGHPPERKGMD
ncbi:MAG: pyrroline-5-carboxylate reductase [Anaerolineae bacterium]|nr:pyrroline-5-carboxylate reductase [Anaerolineae bacterium]